MVPSSAGSIVLVTFPLSDLTQTKLRPAVVIAGAERGDWVLCQITSNAYSDPRAVALPGNDFANGGLRVMSYARPGKLFTANQRFIVSEVGTLNTVAFVRVVQAVAALVQSGLPKSASNNPSA
jgi:mRNA interferase MazF